MEFVVLFVFSSLFVGYSSACNGIKIKVTKLENCAGDDQVLKISENTTMTLSKDCQLLVDGCMTSKPFKTAMAKFEMYKDGLLMRSGEADICAKLSRGSDDALSFLKMAGLPNKCPVDNFEKCVNKQKKMNFAQLVMAQGKLSTKITMEHDTGKSCFNINAEIKPE